MKKYVLILFLFSFSTVYLFSIIETIITPTVSYSNYALNTVYTSRKTNVYLHTVSFGFDLLFIGNETGFTFFANNSLSFMDETQVFGDIDFISGKGASIIEKIIFNISLLTGYTFYLNENLKFNLGAGLGFFHSYLLKDCKVIAVGFVMASSLNYFFIHSLGMVFGIEDGFYGDIIEKLPNEKLKFLHKIQIKLGLSIRF